MAINSYFVNERAELLLLKEKESDLWLAMSGVIKDNNPSETIKQKAMKELSLTVNDYCFIDSGPVGDISMHRFLIQSFTGKISLTGKYVDYKWVKLSAVATLPNVCPFVKSTALKIIKIMQTIKKGTYRHYKGKEYQVIGEAKNTETKKLEVIYQLKAQADKIWARPKNVFLDDVEVDGCKKPRFEFITETEEDNWEYQYKLALADYQNLLKKTAADKTEFAKYAITDLLEDIIPVYDHLKMSLSSLPETEEKSPWVQGVGYVLKQFKDALGSRGVEEIKTIGEKFDHNVMEALEGSGEIVVREIMSGYKLNGRLIKAAKVVVADK